MSISRSLVRYALAAAAACSIVAGTTAAQAAVVAVFDPAFGTSIPNLGFRGSITLDVTPGCYIPGPGFRSVGGGCQITPTSAIVNFYNATTNSEVLTTVPLAGSFFAASYVIGAYFNANGEFAGLDTNDSSQFSVLVNDSNSPPPIYNGRMLLYFASGFAPTIQIGRVAAAASVPGVGGAFLVNCNPANQSQQFCSSGDPTTTSNPGRLTFTVVPEPDSIALAMLGLGALAFTRRRTRAAR